MSSKTKCSVPSIISHCLHRQYRQCLNVLSCNTNKPVAQTLKAVSICRNEINHKDRMKRKRSKLHKFTCKHSTQNNTSFITYFLSHRHIAVLLQTSGPFLPRQARRGDWISSQLLVPSCYPVYTVIVSSNTSKPQCRHHYKLALNTTVISRVLLLLLLVIIIILTTKTLNKCQFTVYKWLPQFSSKVLHVMLWYYQQAYLHVNKYWQTHPSRTHHRSIAVKRRVEHGAVTEMLSCILAFQLTEITSDWRKPSHNDTECETEFSRVLTVALSAAVACRRLKPIDSIIDNEPSSGTNCCVEPVPWLACCRGESKSASARQPST